MKRLGGSPGEENENMNCRQFQETLPYIIENGGNPEEEVHLQSCEACSALVRDLRYIADQAKLLLPMHDPSPAVWSNIEESLQREGLVREGRMSRKGGPAAATAEKKLHSVRLENGGSGHSGADGDSDKLSK